MVRKFETLFFSGESGEREILIPSDVALIRLEFKSGTVTAMGRLDRESDPTPISGVSMKDFSTSINMSGGQIWTIDCSGLYKVIVNYTGTDEVLMKTIV